MLCRLLLSLVVALVLCASVYSQSTVKARAWQAANPAFPTAADFPESAYIPSDKPSTAIGFTGGGSRAYLCAIGELAALTKLDLISKVRYIGGISGGSWATMVYTFNQNGASDAEFLGEITMPEKLTLDNVKEMSPLCSRGFASGNMTFIALKAFEEKVVTGIADAWTYGIQKTYLDPAKIPENIPFTWNEQSLKEIRSANPLALKDTQFVLPTNSDRPFPLIGTSLVGPAEDAPFGMDAQNFTMIEITPLYTGQMCGHNVDYIDSSSLTKKVHTRYVGGVVESFAVETQGETAPNKGLYTSTKGTLDVPKPQAVLDIKRASSASSYAPGALFESLKPQKLSEALGLSMDYWSPHDLHPVGKKTLFGDGGSYENIPLISFLQRRVERIVLFFNAMTPLQPSSKWNVDTEPFVDQIDDCLVSFFGVFPASQPNWQNRSYETERNHVFPTSEYYNVIKGLQNAQTSGNGIIYTAKLTTIRNDWWGIPEGVTAEVTFVYLGRLVQWEKRLNPEMHKLLVPEGDKADDLSADIDKGPFRKFPHYMTIAGEINHERANVLSDLTGWAVLKNADLFKRIFS